MKLPDTVLAFKLLDCARLTDEQKQLVLTLGNDLKLLSMKSALKRIFLKVEDTSGQDFGMIQIKKEKEEVHASHS